MNANDILVRRMTAFRSWNDMAASMKTGYVPTIRRTKAGHKLARVVETAGFNTFRIR